MEISTPPVCLSQYFVNKQNVRSYTNIIKANILKDEVSTSLLLHVFEEKSLVSELPPEFLDILTILKNNLRSKAKGDFKNYFSNIERQDLLKPINKTNILMCSFTALNEIIPRSLLGGNSNTKVLKKLIQTVVLSMNRQHIMIEKFIEKWDFTSHPWNFNIEIAKRILIKILIWIIKNVLAAMICLNFYVTTCKLDADENKLHFFWKSHWQSFYDKKISNMIFTKILKRFDPHCLGKKSKNNHSYSERLKLKALKKEIPRLYLVLKPNNDCRPIVRYKNSQSPSEKYKMRDRLNFLKTMSGKPRKKIELQFNSLYQQWLNLKQPKHYFIKTDLSNAFGSIDKEKLMKILCETHMKFQKTEKSLYMKQKMAQQYKEIVAELRKPLLIRAGNTVYEWTRGLVQGYKYSPALSELYYAYLDELYFAQHLKQCEEPQIRYFIRVVDDYLYLTDSLEDAHLFLEALSSYRNVNYEKTIVNFNYENIKSSNQITFLGYSYDTNTLQVSRANNVFVGQMCYKIAFSSAMENLSKFMENRIGQSGIQINSHIFNLTHNTEELVWKHIFTTFCLSANKFCTILAVLCEPKEMKQYLNLYKTRVAIKLSNRIIETLMKNKPQDFLFMYCINHFRYLAFKALYLGAKHTSKCSGLVPLINDELAKSNCLFGKWNEHYCRVETNGEMRSLAIKQVCRRSDLRVILKNFETLPSGFQCYNHKQSL